MQLVKHTYSAYTYQPQVFK